VKFDFSPKGTKYFILSAVSTLNPLGKERLEEIKYDLMKNGGNEYKCGCLFGTKVSLYKKMTTLPIFRRDPWSLISRVEPLNLAL